MALQAQTPISPAPSPCSTATPFQDSDFWEVHRTRPDRCDTKAMEFGRLGQISCLSSMLSMVDGAGRIAWWSCKIMRSVNMVQTSLVIKSSLLLSLIGSYHRRCPQLDCPCSLQHHALARENHHGHHYSLHISLTISTSSWDGIRPTRCRRQGYRAPCL